uniref:Ribosomal protein L23 n=1 Tax=Olisthodiscus luteus TaxID=83000 RepID=A0A7U0KT68_OLILU|nr:ribosomal protein L23 [Olisthodiscus luteus]QQW50594.1 ribosomal protein L23 [Olisthodiscus luteus]
MTNQFNNLNFEKYKYIQFINCIKYPILTAKASRLLEMNKYTFIVDFKADKPTIANAIEYLFKVKVKKIQTIVLPVKKKRFGKFVGNCSRYKKAYITLHKDYKIKAFSDLT